MICAPRRSTLRIKPIEKNRRSTSDDRPNEGRVSRTIDQGDLHLFVRRVRQMFGQIDRKRRKAEIQGDASRLTLRIFIERVRTREEARRLGTVES